MQLQLDTLINAILQIIFSFVYLFVISIVVLYLDLTLRSMGATETTDYTGVPTTTQSITSGATVTITIAGVLDLVDEGVEVFEISIDSESISPVAPINVTPRKALVFVKDRKSFFLSFFFLLSFSFSHLHLLRRDFKTYIFRPPIPLSTFSFRAHSCNRVSVLPNLQQFFDQDKIVASI